MTRRSYGTGSLYVRADNGGRESWYGKWHSNGRRVKRRIGLKRAEGSRDGLTRPQAEAELRRLIAEVQVTPTVGHSLTVATAGERYRQHLKRAGRKRSTIAAVESALRVQLEPFFAGKALDAIRHEDVVDLVAVLEGKGLSPKSIHNYLHGLRHTFGTRMAVAGVPMRTLQEWMGHRDISTTERYADYAPSQHESELIARAWASNRPGRQHGIARLLFERADRKARHRAGQRRRGRPSAAPIEKQLLGWVAPWRVHPSVA